MHLLLAQALDRRFEEPVRVSQVRPNDVDRVRGNSLVRFVSARLRRVIGVWTRSPIRVSMGRSGPFGDGVPELSP